MLLLLLYYIILQKTTEKKCCISYYFFSIFQVHIHPPMQQMVSIGKGYLNVIVIVIVILFCKSGVTEKVLYLSLFFYLPATLPSHVSRTNRKYR